MRVVVVPDIHGRLDALTAILEHSGAIGKNGEWVKPGFTLLQLGDLIDRGPQVRECVEWMIRLQEQAGRQVVVLKGNHEDLLLKSFQSAMDYGVWLMNGAKGTLQSYGADFEKLCQPGGPHYRWMDGLPSHWVQGKVLFAHGGLSKKNIKTMKPEALMWDRPPSLVRGPYEAVVCGHTPTSSGHIEHKDGIFYCDIGLGQQREAGIEYLSLELSEEGVERWERVEIK